MVCLAVMWKSVVAPNKLVPITGNAVHVLLSTEQPRACLFVCSRIMAAINPTEIIMRFWRKDLKNNGGANAACLYHKIAVCVVNAHPAYCPFMMWKPRDCTKCCCFRHAGAKSALLLLFRKGSHSAHLVGCKRLPTYCGFKFISMFFTSLSFATYWHKKAA